MGSHLEPVYRLPPIHQSSFNEREHCWTDYENPSHYPRLFLELPRQTSDWQHRGAAVHRLLAVWAASVHKQTFAADRVEHNNKLCPFPPLHLLPTAPRLRRSNES